MKKVLKCKGELVNVNGHNMHIYKQGDISKPKLVLMAGSATVAPIYDFKVLYEKLVDDFRVIVIEKFGYGYSEIYDSPGDIDSLVSLQKQALEAIGEKGPYILMPHSMSGLEALRWKQIYSDDVRAIIGNDMATPLTYSVWTEEKVAIKVKMMKTTTKYGISKFLCQLNNKGLTNEEIQQHKLLRKRNAFNICYINEANEVMNNVEIVKNNGYKKCPALLFSSNGYPMSEHWTRCQKEFAKILDARLVSYDCGHYIHHFKSEEMSKEIVNFVKSLER